MMGVTHCNLKAIVQGYYATKSATGNNDLDFWFVRVQTEGRYAGFRSVSRVLGGRGTQRIHNGEQMTALRAILAAGTEAAGMLFAQELGRCRKCGRDLTDDTSRQLGIGPVCRAQ
jgi:isocitrate/isopropylmalate dehydrogenase